MTARDSVSDAQAGEFGESGVAEILEVFDVHPMRAKASRRSATLQLAA
jgi:hypothetical protein